MLNFIKQNRCHQHRIHLVATRFPFDDWLQCFKPIHRLGSQRLELVHAPGEQLSESSLGAMHTKTPLEHQELFRAEDTRIFLQRLRLDLSIDQWQLRSAPKVSNGQTDEAQNSRYGNNLASKKTHTHSPRFRRENNRVIPIRGHLGQSRIGSVVKVLRKR